MRVVILGLDGTSFNVLEPLMDDGVIPHIKRLCDEGAHGPMRTIIPPVTAPAWLALATGIGILLGHIFWGTPWIPGQLGD